MPIALKVKDQELADGLDATGGALKDITARTRKYRRSAMVPGGKGDPNAPPLMPGYAAPGSFAIRRAGDGGQGRALLEIRSIHRCDVRRDPGLSGRRGQGRIRDLGGRAGEDRAAGPCRAWNAWKRSGIAPSRRRPRLPAPRQLSPKHPRIAGIVARSQQPHAGTERTAGVGTLNRSNATFGIGTATTGAQRWAV